MNLPFSMNDISKATDSSGQAKKLMTDAMAMAGDYLKGIKGLAGGQPGVPMKTMAREEMEKKNLDNYYTSQGLIAPISANDPSAQIRKLGDMWAATEDPALKDLYHQQALKLAQGSGWLKPGEQVDSVVSMAQMTNAGLPDPKYQQALAQQFVENQLKQQIAETQKINASKSGGGGSSGSVIDKGPTAAEKLANTAEAKRRAQEKLAVYAPGNPNAISGLEAWMNAVEPEYEDNGVNMQAVRDYIYRQMGYGDEKTYLTNKNK